MGAAFRVMIVIFRAVAARRKNHLPAQDSCPSVPLVVRILHGDSGSHSGRPNVFSPLFPFLHFTCLHSFISSLVHSVFQPLVPRPVVMRVWAGRTGGRAGSYSGADEFYGRCRLVKLGGEVHMRLG